MRIRIVHAAGSEVVEVIDDSPGRLELVIVEDGSYSLRVYEDVDLDDVDEVIRRVLDELSSQ